MADAAVASSQLVLCCKGMVSVVPIESVHTVPAVAVVEAVDS